MTGEELREARATLGRMWGLRLPLGANELGRLLGLKAEGKQILDMESGKKPVSGPVALAMQAMLDGWTPPQYRKP
jgi:hypothetical protein